MPSLRYAADTAFAFAALPLFSLSMMPLFSPLLMPCHFRHDERRHIFADAAITIFIDIFACRQFRYAMSDCRR